MIDHKIGSHDEWLAAREKLLEREKEHTRMGDELAQQRRELPWVAINKQYRFDTDDGTRTLAELFDAPAGAWTTSPAKWRNCGPRASRSRTSQSWAPSAASPTSASPWRPGSPTPTTTPSACSSSK